MTSTHAKIVAEIAELQRLQMQSMREAVFGGWTEKDAAAQQRRSDRIAELRCQMALVDNVPPQ